MELWLYDSIEGALLKLLSPAGQAGNHEGTTGSPAGTIGRPHSALCHAAAQTSPATSPAGLRARSSHTSPQALPTDRTACQKSLSALPVKQQAHSGTKAQLGPPKCEQGTSPGLPGSSSTSPVRHRKEVPGAASKGVKNKDDQISMQKCAQPRGRSRGRSQARSHSASPSVYPRDACHRTQSQSPYHSGVAHLDVCSRTMPKQDLCSHTLCPVHSCLYN